MDFFRSVFSDDPEHTDPVTTSTSSPDSLSHPSNPKANPNPTPKLTPISTGWTFGSSLIKTLASKSESVIDTYRRDLEEFSSGLKKETAVIREAARRAVKELPTSLEAGAAAAQKSLESVGQAIDNLGSTVTGLISQGREFLGDDSDSETSEIQNSSFRPYSRLDAQIRMIQCDMNTYLVEPDDWIAYNEWKVGLELGEKVGEIKELIAGNREIEEIRNEIVPDKVDDEVFWSRYFYRVYKVKRAEEARAKLVKRVISGEEEEELSWDVDEDDYVEGDGGQLKRGDSEGGSEEDSLKEKDTRNSVVETEFENLKEESDDKSSFSEITSINNVGKKQSSDGAYEAPESSGNTFEAKPDEQMAPEGKNDQDSDFSVVSSQPSREGEDLGWDEIEDIGANDEIKVASWESPATSDLFKLLSTAEVDEDLNWDIEDDDEPLRS